MTSNPSAFAQPIVLAAPRPYREDADWHAMLALLRAGRRANNGTYYVHTGDVSWWQFYHADPDPFTDQVWLWEAAGRLLGWVLFTPAEGYFDLFVQPDLRGTPEAEAMHAWAEAGIAARVRARGGATLRAFWILETDTVRREWLERRGFVRGGGALNYMTQTLEALPPAPARPAGFSVRPVAGAAEAEPRARASYGAFRSTWEWGPYLARYQRFTRSRVYDRERDLVAAAPDGRIAAFAIWWPDDENGLGLFEPVGTHPDFQRRGLGRAVIWEGLRRMRARGLRQAAVCSEVENPGAVAFYETCGFQTENHLLLYEKQLAATLEEHPA